MPRAQIGRTAVILSLLLAAGFSDAEAEQSARLRSGRASGGIGSSSPPPGLEDPARPIVGMSVSPAVPRPTWMREHRTGRLAKGRTGSSMQGLSQRPRGYGTLDFSASTPGRAEARKSRPLVRSPEKPYFRSVIRSSPKVSYIRRRKPLNGGHIRNGSGSSLLGKGSTSIVATPINSIAAATSSIAGNSHQVSVSSGMPSVTSQSANQQGKDSALTKGLVILRTTKTQLEVRGVNVSADQRLHTADENRIGSSRVKTAYRKVGKGGVAPIRHETARPKHYRTKEFYTNRSTLPSTKKVQVHASKVFATQPKPNAFRKTPEQKSEIAPVELLGLYEVGLLPNTTEFLHRRTGGGPAKQSVARWNTGGQFVGNAGKVVFPLHVLPALPGAPPAPDWPKIPPRPHRPYPSALPGYPGHSHRPAWPGVVVPAPAPDRPVHPHIRPVKPSPAGTVEPALPPNTPAPAVPSPFKPPTVEAGPPFQPGPSLPPSPSLPPTPSLPPSPPPPEGALGPPVTVGEDLICVYLRASGRPLLLHADLTSGQYNISDGLTHADSGQLQLKPQQTRQTLPARETLILDNNASSVGDLIAQVRRRTARWKEGQKPFSNIVCIVQRPEAGPEATPTPSDEPPSVPVPTKVTAPEAEPTPTSAPTVGDAMSSLSDSVSAAVDALTTSAGDTLSQTMSAADSTALVISANVKDYIGTNIPTIALATTVGIPVLVALLSLLGAPPLLLSAMSVSSPVLMQSLASLYNMLPSG